MARRFTRNIISIENIENQPKETNQQNDLLSDDTHVYVRNKDKYENLTNSVKSVNQKTIDKNGNVDLDTGVMKVNGKDPDDKGNVDVDLTGYAKKDYVNQSIKNLNIPEQPDLTGYAKKDYVNQSIENLNIPEQPDLTGYAKEDYVDQSIENLNIPEQPDLTGYAKKEHGELELEEDFTGNLDYFKTGNLLKINGYIKNIRKIEQKEEILFCKLPNKFKSLTNEVNLQRQGFDFSLCYVKKYSHSNFPNGITIRNEFELEENSTISISLIVGIE